MFFKKGVLRNLTKFTGKHLCKSLFFNKVAGLRPAALLKKRLWHRCFPVNFAKFLRTPFFTEHLHATASQNNKLTLEPSKATCNKSLALCIFLLTPVSNFLRIPSAFAPPRNWEVWYRVSANSLLTSQNLT